MLAQYTAQAQESLTIESCIFVTMRVYHSLRPLHGILTIDEQMLQIIQRGKMLS